jgi:ribosomal protein S8
MKFIVLLLNKLNNLTTNKKQILEIIFKNTKQQQFVNNILYMLYHYGYILSYKYFYLNNNLTLRIYISNTNTFKYKLLTKPTYQFNIKKKYLNNSLNIFQSLIYTNPNGIQIHPYNKNNAGILLFKITT